MLCLSKGCYWVISTISDCNVSFCLKSVLWERVETVIWKTAELHTPEGTKASFIIGSDHTQQWQTLILKPLESCSQSPCCTSVNNIYTLISVPYGGSLYTHSRKEGQMQSCTAISPHRNNYNNREQLGLRICLGNPYPSIVMADVGNKKKLKKKKGF